MSRADRVVARLGEREVDALLVTDLVNIRYLTGFTGSSAMVVIGPDTRRFITDFRYVERAKAEVSGFDQERAPQEFAEALKEGWPEGPVRLGFEDQHVSVSQHARLRELLPDRIELVRAGGLVEAERAVKEPAEVEAIRVAAALVDDIYAWLFEAGIVGRTEREVALALEEEMRRRGATRAELPLDRRLGRARRAAARRAARRRDRPGVLVTLDLGAEVDGYCSDCTRTWATGEIDGDLAAIYDLVLRAQEAALGAVRAGPTGREVDAVARDHDHRRGAWGALRPRARPRRRAPGPRGPAAGPIGHRAPGGGECGDRRARRLRARAAAACGSRISWSSPRTAATC